MLRFKLFILWFASTAVACAGTAHGQAIDFTVPEFSLTVEIPSTENETRNLLALVDQHLDQENWNEALDVIDTLTSEHGHELTVRGEDQFGLGSRYEYFTNLKSYLRIRVGRFARNSPGFLKTCRERVDPLAREVFREASDANDVRALKEAVDSFYFSSETDDGLLLLGDLLLEQGDFRQARAAWEQISPAFRTPKDPSGVLLAMPGQPMWIAVDGVDWTQHREYIQQLLSDASFSAQSSATIPDYDLDLAAVWARLCLTSWLEGSHRRARAEWLLIKNLFPNAVGHIGGKDQNFANFLSDLIHADAFQGQPADADWKTFAANQQRLGVAVNKLSNANYHEVWQLALKQEQLARRDSEQGIGLKASIELETEDANQLLSTYPIVVDGNVIFCDRHRVRVVDLETGNPSFAAGPSLPNQDLEYGSVFSIFRRDEFHNSIRPSSSDGLGAPRFTVSSNGKLFAVRLGISLDNRVNTNQLQRTENDLLVFDLDAEGKLAAQIPPNVGPAENWKFEGAPILDGHRLYVGMSESGIRDRSAVACFDWKRGQLLWRTEVCLTQPYSGLVTEGSSRYLHHSHKLLSLHEGNLYYNTNHGVIASIACEDGVVNWSTKYPRRNLIPTRLNEAQVKVQRDLNPCICADGMIVAMPMDCDRLVALDSTTGQIIWQTVPGGIDPVHLLGIVDEHVITSGKRLCWIDLHSGKIRAEFPAVDQAIPRGRGILTQDTIYWPTEGRIHRLQTKLGPDATVQPAAPPLSLVEEGGNLVISDGYLLIAGSRDLRVFRQAP